MVKGACIQKELISPDEDLRHMRRKFTRSLEFLMRWAVAQ